MVNANAAAHSVPATVAARVLALVNTGVSPVDALRTVCGAELVDNMISTLYDELRARG